jgi:hypothetical protein
MPDLLAAAGAVGADVDIEEFGNANSAKSATDKWRKIVRLSHGGNYREALQF